MLYTTLIGAPELAQSIADPGWVVLDCRHDLSDPDAGVRAFETGHIPGSQFACLDKDLSDKTPGANGEFKGRHPLPERTAFLSALRRWGINDDTQVIAYDAHGGMFAARLWWMLRWAGHQGVAVLDGGLPAWTALDLPLSAACVTKTPGTPTVRAPLTSIVDANDLLINLVRQTHIVVDARAPDRFRGENETLDLVGGHIPGAKNRFFKNNLQADGRFRPAEQLRTEFGMLIGAPDGAVMQCGSGVTACHNLLALELAGLPGAALYPGSWSEWCADSSRPVATGG